MFLRKWAVVAAVLALSLIITSIAFAAPTTIDTTDGGVDGNWANVSVLRDDGDDIGNDNYDINQAWIANAADNSAFYFRVSLVGTGQLPHDYSSFEARLDCNQDGDFQDAEDVVVYYALNGANEELVECQGSDYSECDFKAGNTSDTNAITFGEEISAGSYNYEWRADTTNGDADWLNCFGPINVQFASLDSTFAPQDTTEWRSYSVPLSVHQTSFTARPDRSNQIGLVLASALFLLICGVWIWRLVSRSTLGQK